MFAAHYWEQEPTTATGSTVFDWASTFGELKLCSDCIDAGACVTAATASGHTALHSAGHFEVCDALLAGAAGVNAATVDGSTALMMIVLAGARLFPLRRILVRIERMFSPAHR